MNIPEANKFATDSGLTVKNLNSEFTDKILWSIEGRLGIYRRVKRLKQGLKPSVEGRVVAEVDGALREFIRWSSLDEELLSAGYVFVDPDDEPDGVDLDDLLGDDEKEDDDDLDDDDDLID